MEQSTNNNNNNTDIILHQPDEWSVLNHREKINSIWWTDTGPNLKELGFDPYIQTDDDDDTTWLLQKIAAAKFALTVASSANNKHHEEYEAEVALYKGSDGESLSDGGYQPEYYAYPSDLLKKFASALIYNYTFELCFRVESENPMKRLKHRHCICPCTLNNERWRQLFEIDCVGEAEQCKMKGFKTTKGILQHLQSKHNNGISFLHTLAYMYIMKLYQSSIPEEFLRDLPTLPRSNPGRNSNQSNNDNNTTSSSTTTRKRKQEISSEECNQRSKKTSYPPCDIEYTIQRTTDSSSISTITSSVSKKSSDKKVPSVCSTTSSHAKKSAAASSSAEKPAAASSSAEKPAATSSSTKKPAATSSSTEKPAATSSSTEKPAATSSSAKKPAATSSSAKKPAATSSEPPAPLLTVARATVPVHRATVPVARVARSSTFHCTISRRTRVEGDITITYRHNRARTRDSQQSSTRTRRRNKSCNEAKWSQRNELTDFIQVKKNKRNPDSYAKKTIYIIDTSSDPTEESPLGRVCPGVARCYGSGGRFFPPSSQLKEGDPDQKFEWVLKLINRNVDLYMNNHRMVDIASRDGSQDRPYFGIFIGNPVFPPMQR